MSPGINVVGLKGFQPIPLPPLPQCVYCGQRAKRRVLGARVCRVHDDLPGLDPHYADPGDQWEKAR